MSGGECDELQEIGETWTVTSSASHCFGIPVDTDTGVRGAQVDSDCRSGVHLYLISWLFEKNADSSETAGCCSHEISRSFFFQQFYSIVKFCCLITTKIMRNELTKFYFFVGVGLLLHLNFQAAGYQLQISDVVSSSRMYSHSTARDRRICLTANVIPAGRFDALLGVASFCRVGRNTISASRFEAMGIRKSKTGVSGMGMMAEYMFGMEGISLQPGDRAFIVGADIKRDK